MTPDYRGILADWLARYWPGDDGKMQHVLKPRFFAELYEDLFGPIRHDVERVLEIGVYQGHSLRMWEAFFPNATIVGIDHHAPYAKHEAERVKVRIGKQADLHFLTAVVDEFGPFDIIIDDGSHHWEDQRATLDYFWPTPWRYYVVEDVHTSYVEHSRPAVEGVSPAPFTATVNSIVDGMHCTRLPSKFPASLNGNRTVKRVVTMPGIVAFERNSDV